MAIEADAHTLFKMCFDAAVKAQVIDPKFGITAPPPALTLSSGLPANSQMDQIEGATAKTLAYMKEGVPQAWVIRGTVSIPNPEAPNDPPQNVDVVAEYIGQLIKEQKDSGKTTLIFRTVTGGATGEFEWV